MRVAPRRTTEPGAATAAVAAPVAAPPALDQRGTRRARRIKVAVGLEVLVDGNPASLVDLSILGAQVVSASVLKPNQRVRVSIQDEMATIRFNAAVAWASFEIPPKSGPRYRAGVEFIDADAVAVDAYCARHQV
jgi:archaeosine-15-forming tRNA-guanine transglycosylase